MLSHVLIFPFKWEEWLSETNEKQQSHLNGLIPKPIVNCLQIHTEFGLNKSVLLAALFKSAKKNQENRSKKGKIFGKTISCG